VKSGLWPVELLEQEAPMSNTPISRQRRIMVCNSLPVVRAAGLASHAKLG
jgi:hypothetical protein